MAIGGVGGGGGGSSSPAPSGGGGGVSSAGDSGGSAPSSSGGGDSATSAPKDTVKISEGDGPTGAAQDTPNFANSLGGKPASAEKTEAGLSGGGRAGEGTVTPAAPNGPPINSQLGTPGEWSQPDARGNTTRTVPTKDGKGDFTETKGPDGSSYLSRQTKDENGRVQTEQVSGDRHTVVPVNPLQDAQSAPAGNLSYTDGAGNPAQIKTLGADQLSQTQRDNLKSSIERLPPALQNVTKSLYFDKNLGYADSASTDSPRQNVAGLASPEQRAIGFRPDSLDNPDTAKDLVAHEYTHVFDAANGNPSAQAPWGNADSVSKYGRTNGAEDFAETGANVVGDLDRYRKMTADQWAAEPQAAKKQQMLSLLGY